MNTAQSNPRRWSIFGAMITALAASICCIGPLAFLALGVGGAWAGSLRVLEPYRPIFMMFTLGFLAFAFYRAYRAPATAACASDGSCTVPRAGRVGRVALWIVTPIILALLAFPYFAPRLFAGSTAAGASSSCASCANAQDSCCSPSSRLGTVSAEDLNMRQNANADLISLFEVPLECSAAPQIGCGLRAKPILLQLQRDPTIASAWLNNAGTVLAVVGAEGSSRESRASAAQTAAMAKDGSAVTELQGEARRQQLSSFRSADAWYRGAEVDALSKQEADIIAARLVHRVQAKVTLPDQKAKVLETAIAEASYRYVSGQADIPQGDFMQKYGKELMNVAAQANLDETQIAALKDAASQGFHPGPNEK